MKTYNVTVEVTAEVVFAVRAEDEEQARTAALRRADQIDLPDRSAVVTDIEVVKEAAE